MLINNYCAKYRIYLYINVKIILKKLKQKLNIFYYLSFFFNLKNINN